MRPVLIVTILTVAGCEGSNESSYMEVFDDEIGIDLCEQIVTECRDEYPEVVESDADYAEFTRCSIIHYDASSALVSEDCEDEDFTIVFDAAEASILAEDTSVCEMNVAGSLCWRAPDLPAQVGDDS